jgi:hypothetical protein
LNIEFPNYQSAPSCVRDQTYFNFRKADYSKICSFISSFDWSSTFSLLDLDSAMNSLFDALHRSIIDFVPKCVYYVSSYPPWFSKELKQILFLKKKAHLKFKASSNVCDYREFSLLRAKFKYESKKCLRNYAKRAEQLLKKNPRSYWKFINCNRSDNDIPKQLSFNGSVSSDKQGAADLLASYFSSVYSNNQSVLNLDDLNIPPFDLPNNISISVDDVFNSLSALHGSSSIGPDGLPGEFLFQLRFIISYPLWIIFNRSLNEGIFPSMLKFSSVTPILKSGTPSSVLNYRPISIQSHIAKIFESLVLKVIQRPVNNILMEEQHGFRPGRSTTTCNLLFNNFVFESFQQRLQVDVVYTDFNKAFDLVDHEVLIKILSSYGFGEPFLSWLTSYLSDRYQWVNIFGTKSKLFLASSGVPQGGHLSPLLFSLFVNNISRVLRHSRILCFADDIKLFLRVGSIDDCLHLQSDLDSFVYWFKNIGLSLNVSKCKILTYTRSRSPIIYSYNILGSEILRANESVIDLGFKLTSSLDPRPHIDMVCCKALKILGFINRLASDFKLDSSFKLLYCTLVRPILEYGVVVWSPFTANDSLQLERVQRRFLRSAGFLLGIEHPPHDYSAVAAKLGLVSLAERRRMLCVKFLKGLLSGQIDSSDLLSLLNFKVPPRQNRSSVPFHVPICPSNYMKNEPIRRLMLMANEDPSIDL